MCFYVFMHMSSGVQGAELPAEDILFPRAKIIDSCDLIYLSAGN